MSLKVVLFDFLDGTFNPISLLNMLMKCRNLRFSDSPKYQSKCLLILDIIVELTLFLVFLFGAINEMKP